MPRDAGKATSIPNATPGRVYFGGIHNAIGVNGNCHNIHNTKYPQHNVGAGFVTSHRIPAMMSDKTRPGAIAHRIVRLLTA
jgi:hypothetical protein